MDIRPEGSIVNVPGHNIRKTGANRSQKTLWKTSVSGRNAEEKVDAIPLHSELVAPACRQSPNLREISCRQSNGLRVIPDGLRGNPRVFGGSAASIHGVNASSLCR